MVYPNICIRAEMRPYGYAYYGMILVYVDDIMIVYDLGDEVAIQIVDFYNIKEESQGPPTLYLGSDMENIQTMYGSEIWTTSSRSFITNGIETVEGLLIEDGKCEVLKYNSKYQFTSNQRPELDSIVELGPKLLS